MRKNPNNERLEKISLLLAEAFGQGAEGLEAQEKFLNGIPEGQKGTRRLMLLGNEVTQNQLVTEIKGLMRKEEPSPQI